MNDTLRIPLLALAATSLFAACEAGQNDPTSADSSTRQRIGKSDWAPVGTCKDACDGKTLDGNCWCDDLCATYGDCCSDKAAVCDGGGCVEDADCGDDQYCQTIYCFAAPCPPATCVAKATEGMQCNDSVPCSEGLACVANTCVPGACHIGGCSGQLCGAQPGMISTCEYKPEYACYKKAGAACEVQVGGGCGWTMTGEAAACLDSVGPQGCATHDDCGADEFCQQIWCITQPCVNPCVARGGAGADCSEDAMCQAGLSCVDGACAAAGGACVGHCGGQADDGCWCDSWCSAYGDCCAGKANDCD